MSLVNTRANGWSSDNRAEPYLICKVSENEWIPLFAKNDYVKINNEVYYTLEIPSTRVNDIPTREIKKTVYYQSHVRKASFPKSEFDFYFQKGFIYHIGDNGKPKILMCSARKPIYEGSIVHNYKTFVHPDVFTQSKYSKIMYYFKKYFIEEALMLDDSEMVITKNIMKLCFKPTKKVLRFQTVDEEEEFFAKLAKAVVSTTAPIPAPEPEMPEPELISTDVPPLAQVALDNVEMIADAIQGAFGVPNDIVPPTAAEFADAEEGIEDVFIDVGASRVVNLLSELTVEMQNRVDELIREDSGRSTTIYAMLESVESIDDFNQFMENTYPEDVEHEDVSENTHETHVLEQQGVTVRGNTVTISATTETTAEDGTRPHFVAGIDPAMDEETGTWPEVTQAITDARARLEADPNISTGMVTFIGTGGDMSRHDADFVDYWVENRERETYPVTSEEAFVEPIIPVEPDRQQHITGEVTYGFVDDEEQIFRQQPYNRRRRGRSYRTPDRSVHDY